MNNIIVSFTSYPARIKNIDKVLQTICEQTILPFKTVLYLAESQFTNKNAGISIERYSKCNFEIHWCPKDLRSHKKYYYAMQEYPDDYIITIDDDLYYPKNMIEALINTAKKYPHAVIACRGSRIVFKDKHSLSSYNNWYNSFLSQTPSMDNFATSGGGTLFPPHLLDKELFNQDVFMKLAPYADDLWLKTVQLLSDVPVAFAFPLYIDEPIEKENTQGLFFEHNQNGGNDKQLNALIDYYKDTKGISLIAKIQKNGFLLEKDAKEQKISNALVIISQWLCDNCGESDFYIYGAGKVADVFYRTLRNIKMESRIICALVDNVANNKSEYFAIDNFRHHINDRNKIILCVGKKLQAEVISLLSDSGLDMERVIILPRDILFAMQVFVG